ncbi:MAG: 50S ribosomal protein L19 [Holosporaceae bacterium]|jgi:large subunit ribosomal protein L19|nr:50S ribosomal protein L19 [Holosporaceae bacterium]
MNALQNFEKKELERLTSNRAIPRFFAGDILKVQIKVVEGEKERMQSFEGVCIARRNRGLGSSVTVRKISFGEGVEKVFPLYSSNIKIEVVRRGSVRRAKLYYLRGRLGKSARIAENNSFNSRVNENKGAEVQSNVAEVETETEGNDSPE